MITSDVLPSGYEHWSRSVALNVVQEPQDVQEKVDEVEIEGNGSHDELVRRQPGVDGVPTARVQENETSRVEDAYVS